jgi:hypothetical protein
MLKQFMTVAKARIAALEQRAQELEQRSPELPYKGIWGAAETYSVGHFVTHDGSVCVSKSASSGVRPGSNPNIWLLAVKRGSNASCKCQCQARGQ